MPFNTRQLAGNSTGNWFGRFLAFLITGTVIVLGVMFSVVFLAVAAVFGLLLWAYVKWTMHRLRQRMAAQMAEMAAAGANGFAAEPPWAGTVEPAGDEGRVIDGEVIHRANDSHLVDAQGRQTSSVHDDILPRH